VYEWHGWATLSKTPTVDYDDDLDRETLSTLRALLAKSDTTFNETADLRSANGEWHVWLAGCHNHRTPAIVGLFRAIAREVPGSYGILYTFDDEVSDGWDRWVMRHGGVQKTQDEDLSPHVGVVEDSEEPGARGPVPPPKLRGRHLTQKRSGYGIREAVPALRPSGNPMARS
jgi:Immunity protein 7